MDFHQCSVDKSNENGDDDYKVPSVGVDEEYDQVFPNIFITVGTTSYDELITWAQDPDTINQFSKWKTVHVKLQIGSSKICTEGSRTIGHILFQFYYFKTTLFEDYEWADLVISHAGAGTVLDVLDLRKSLFVLPNESLMDNHQVELGTFLQNEHFAYSSSLAEAHGMMNMIRRSGVGKFPPRNLDGFAEAVEEIMNFDIEELAKAKMGEMDQVNCDTSAIKLPHVFGIFRLIGNVVDFMLITLPGWFLRR